MTACRACISVVDKEGPKGRGACYCYVFATTRKDDRMALTCESNEERLVPSDAVI
jgi:hypothetical protein